MNAENSNEVDALLIEWEEGTLDDHDMDRLRAMLRTDESLRNQFVQMQMLQAALTLERDAGFEIPTIDEAVQDLDPSTTTTDKS